MVGKELTCKGCSKCIYVVSDNVNLLLWFASCAWEIERRRLLLGRPVHGEIVWVWFRQKVHGKVLKVCGGGE